MSALDQYIAERIAALATEVPSVLDQLRALTKQENALKATPCEKCRHAWCQHLANPVRGMGACLASRCRCKRYVDPNETLEGAT